jgi:hypothetical protein
VARTLFLLGFCSLALAQTPSGPAAANGSAVDWRFAHPDADMKMSLNLQALLNSPAIAKAIDQGKSQAGGNAMQIELAMAMLKTVDRISLSVHQKAPAAGKAAPGSDVDVLVQVTGAFDSQLIAGLFPSTGSSKVKVVGPHTLLIGDGDSFAQAAERMKSGAPVPNDELEKGDIWFSASSSFLAQQAGTSSPIGNTPPALQGLRRLSLGLNLSEAPELNMLLTATDSKAATEMLTMFQAGAGQLAQLNATAGDAAKTLTMKQEGSNIRLHLVVPAELVALAQQQVSSGALPSQLAPLLGGFGMGAFGGSKPSTAVTPEPPPQNGGKIVIYGLDGGPKQMPAN